MYILMDLVVNHCSDEHEWFEKACEDPDGEYGNFFYIEDRKEGELPCNWRSYFGGPVWEPLPGHPDKQYMHVFHKKQPDLNWENPKVREEVYKNINWWLDKGLGGFRIDAIINIKKKLPYKDYTVDRDDNLSCIDQMLADAKGVGEFLGEMRDKTFKPHNAFTVGEVFNEKDEELPDFIGDNGYFSSMFDLPALPLEKVIKAGMQIPALLQMIIKNVVSTLRKESVRSDFYLTLLKIMMNHVVSAIIFRKESVPTKAKNAGYIILHASWTSVHLSRTGNWYGKSRCNSF